MVRPGSIVRFRNRDWVMLPSEDPDIALLRPLTGTSDDVVAVHKQLSNWLGCEFPWEQIVPSVFPLPSPDKVADAQSLHLLWQSARLLLREGAAPLRSLGRISVRPRPYQLVPLMMALRLDPVRLLIADDVGVGKTIEAALVVRELWERGEIRRLAVLCPPYLCDQWHKELVEKFHLEAVVINSATVGQLDRRKPPDRTIYEHYPVQVISIDFVKHERNKHAFLLRAPELIVVDEAHGAVPARGREQHLRYELVRELAADRNRHLILLTATPHSGIPESFQKLLGLLDPEFERWQFSQLDNTQRARLARHFVQRTRKDIQNFWKELQSFPKRVASDARYTLSPAYRELFNQVYEFSRGIVETGQKLVEHQRRMRWWSALALLRCVMSSPRAGKVALEKRRKGEFFPEAEDESDALSGVYEPDNLRPNDEIPTSLVERAWAEVHEPQRQKLRHLEKLAEGISEADDRKLTGCIKIVEDLLRAGFQPVVWCLYVDTAEYVAEKLQAALVPSVSDLRVLCLTGRTGEEERRRKVEELADHTGPWVLVATDCLSEGINLQESFNACVHYDLPWNPNRLEQREGRVDRYGQPRSEVRVVRYYGENNPVDSAVLKILLNKAREIREVLGTYVPVPGEDQYIVDALVHALFYGEERADQQLLLPVRPDYVTQIHSQWDSAVAREKQSRTRFAQHALRPEEVHKQLEATDQVLGDPAAVRNFILTACQKLKLPVTKARRETDVWEIPLDKAIVEQLPRAIREALPAPARRRWRITFSSPTPEGAEYLGRNHPFVATVARYLFEQALSEADGALATRCGAIRTRAVNTLTVLLLLRPRYELSYEKRASSALSDKKPEVLLAEEVLVLGWNAFTDSWLYCDRALPLLQAEPSSNIPLAEKQELVRAALEEITRFLTTEQPCPGLGTQLEKRVQELTEAHRQIRQSVDQPIRGLSVKAHWPPDLLGLLVLQPEVPR
ncbi:MAG: DEAD/DEAH box helicase [Thermoguttaceae bacterium]|nr:DEAD/DEAH box helicase [Thermoguttaceae bacterium]MDW8077616.1 helicase-related protein [Thermoguttaceae bacterium]